MSGCLCDITNEIDPRTRRPAGLHYGTVVIVDEASMIGTRTLARLFDHVDASGARLVLVGDTEQLPEIDAGGLFAAAAGLHADDQRTTVAEFCAYWLKHGVPASAQSPNTFASSGR